jgi:DNA modification methylase
VTKSAPSSRDKNLAQEIYARLSESDWNFTDAYTRGATHGIHSYPAKFIPQIPRALIAALHPGDGSAVMDPFCGSGTTLVEAALAGHPAVGIDLHPLACLLSKVKVTPLSGSLTAAAEAAIERAQASKVALPTIPALDHWFQKAVQGPLASLMYSIESVRDPDMRDALRIVASSIIVRVSNQESDTRYAAVAKAVHKESVWSLFRSAAESIEQSISETWDGLFVPPPVTLLNRDVLTVRASEINIPVSLVVTSPPYPNAYEYWLYHKYRMYWLGMDPIAVREKEIGARPHYFKRRPQTSEDFERQMGSVFALIAEVLTPGGHACFQIGNSKIRGELIDNAAILTRAAERNRFRMSRR